MCPRRSRPRSAAKQGRSFRVTPINSAPTRFIRGHILGKGPPRDRPPAQSKMHILRKEFDVQNPASISGSRNGLPLTRFSRGCPDLRIRKWTLECSCVPKGVGTALCSKTAPFLSCAPNKPSGGFCVRGGRGQRARVSGKPRSRRNPRPSTFLAKRTASAFVLCSKGYGAAFCTTSTTLESARSYFPCSVLEGFRDGSKLTPLQPPARL